MLVLSARCLYNRALMKLVDNNVMVDGSLLRDIWLCLGKLYYRPVKSGTPAKGAESFLRIKARSQVFQRIRNNKIVYETTSDV